MKISAIILAGGKSNRLKYNKETIKIGKDFLIHKQIHTLQNIFDDIIVVTNHPELYQTLNVRTVSDLLEGSSPIIGLHAGLKYSNNPYSYVIACDMPYINLEFIKYLVSKVSTHQAYVAKHNRYIEPFHAIYHKSIISIIEKLVSKNEFGFQNMVKQINTQYIKESEISKFIQKTDIFTNINHESDLFNFHNQNYEYQLFPIEKIVDYELFTLTDKIVTEYPLSLYINNEYYTTLVTTPTNIEFLICGFLKSSLVIDSINDIIEIDIQLSKHKAYIIINKVLHLSKKRISLLFNACKGNTDISNLDYSNMIVTNQHKFYLHNLLDKVSSFNKESILFKETGGVHSVKLIYDDKELFIEDIGRHNAFDKLIGYIMKNNIETSNKYVVSSGRISSDIILKCALSNIPLIISRSAPTSLAINLAKLLHITVLGFARGNKVNIYTFHDRIIKE